jgi:hypothetical protein
MAPDEGEDLYDEEFDFVDDDDEEDDSSPVEEAAADDDSALDEPAGDEEQVDEYGRTPPQANYVVHIYEQRKFKRTIDRPFTPEDAEAFATEYNRTAKSYSRVAVPGKNETPPKKTLE